jgi:hypothetical protein
MSKTITKELLNDMFSYDSITGDVLWVKPINKPVGSVVGSLMSRGYLMVAISGNNYLVHRLIFIMRGFDVFRKQVDHINGDKTDNRWVNLRLVDQIDNLKNKSLRASNKTGISGVSFYSNLKSKPFRVTYYEDGNKRATEFFVPTLFEAACARKSFEYKNEYHENHGRKSTTSK